jgi:hypothetical protein
MENNDILNTWEQHKHVPENEKLDYKKIIQHLKPRLSKVNLSLNFNLIFYLLVGLANIVLLSMNLYGYRNNPIMFATESGLLGLSMVFLGYGVFILIRIREINNFRKDIHSLLQDKIKFMRYHYEIWLIITSIAAWILSFALNTLVDNQDGFYRINRIGLFISITIAMLLFIYGVQKLTTELTLRTLKAFLNDLETSYLEQTTEIERKAKKIRWFYLIIFFILTITCILGLLKATGKI